MADTVTIDGKEWSLDGLPRHMVEGFPLVVDVTIVRGGSTVRERLARMSAVAAGHTASFLPGPVVETIQVQLERDGVPLTLGDRSTSWSPGEADGWKPRAWVQQPHAEEVIEVDAIEC